MKTATYVLSRHFITNSCSLRPDRGGQEGDAPARFDLVGPISSRTLGIATGLIVLALSTTGFIYLSMFLVLLVLIFEIARRRRYGHFRLLKNGQLVATFEGLYGRLPNFLSRQKKLIHFKGTVGEIASDKVMFSDGIVVLRSSSLAKFSNKASFAQFEVGIFGRSRVQLHLHPDESVQDLLIAVLCIALAERSNQEDD